MENLVTHEQFEVHTQRVRFYSDSDLNVTSDLLNQIAHDSTILEGQAITDAKFDKNGRWSLQIHWRGLTAAFDSWERFLIF